MRKIINEKNLCESVKSVGLKESAGHQSPRHILRDGTALLQLASGLRHGYAGWDRLGKAC